MPTNRKRIRRSVQGITPRTIEAYRRLKVLEALDLPDDDPRMKAHGEIDALEYEISKALNVKPWEFGIPRTEKKYKALQEAATGGTL